MYPWDILKLDPNSSLKEIKKAYSILLKDNHPEDNPEGYQRLRKAYDLATKLSKSNTKKSNNLLPENKAELSSELNSSLDSNISINNSGNEEYNSKSNFNPFSNYEIEDNKEDNFNSNFKIFNTPSVNSYDPKEEYTEFLKQLDNIYKNPKLRFNLESWKELFSKPIMWNFQYTDAIYERVLSFLLNNHYLSKEVWTYIDNTFSFSININNYNSKILEYNIFKNLIDKINTLTNLNCDFWGNLDGASLDDYFSFRYELYTLMTNGNIEKAERYFHLAYNLYKDDPDLCKLGGHYYFEQSDYKKALSLYNKAFIAYNDDYYLTYRIAQSYCMEKSYGEAIPYLEFIPDNHFRNGEKFLILAHCYYYTGQFKKSQRYFKNSLDIYINHPYLMKYYKNVGKKTFIKSIRTLNDNFDYILPNYFLNNITIKKNKKRQKTYDFKLAFSLIFILMVVIFHFIEKNENKSNINSYNQVENMKILDNFENTPIDSEIKGKIWNIARLQLHIATDESGKEIYFTSSDFNSDKYKKYKELSYHYHVKNVYFSEDNGKIIILTTDTSSPPRTYDGVLSVYSGKVLKMSPELQSLVSAEISKLYPNGGYSIIKYRMLYD